MAENNFHVIAIVAIVTVVGVVAMIQYSGITGAFGFEKRDVCRIDSCAGAVKGVCDKKKDSGAVMENINDIRKDCNLGRQLSFSEIKSLCNKFGADGAVQKACSSGQCITNADCDDGNPCTNDICSFRGCIHGIPIDDGQSCLINGAIGVCVNGNCQLGAQCIEPVDCVFVDTPPSDIPPCAFPPPCDDDPFDPNIFGIDGNGNLCDPEKHCDGTGPECVEVSSEEIRSGACTDISLIGELGLPQCCSGEAPVDCGADAEWVVGSTALPVCYIQNS